MSHDHCQKMTTNHRTSTAAGKNRQEPYLLPWFISLYSCVSLSQVGVCVFILTIRLLSKLELSVYSSVYITTREFPDSSYVMRIAHPFKLSRSPSRCVTRTRESYILNNFDRNLGIRAR